MKLVYLLVLLSQNGAGDINASFVNTATLEQCQQKALLVEGIFSSAKVPILESRCITSKLIFSEFEHATSTQMPRHFYLIHFDTERVNIRKMPDWKSCLHGKQAGVTQGHIYCSSSIQKLNRSIE